MTIVDSYLDSLVQRTGTPLPALKLFLSILIVYPIAWIYRSFIHGQTKQTKHIFLALCGISLGLFNNGLEVYHSLIAISVTYVFLLTLRGTILTTVSFLFHMGYLLSGYYFTATETYDITWTMPHCVLTLRLIGLAFDVADGQKPESALSAANKKSCLKQAPSLLEIAGYTYFPACYLVGPQFTFRRYESFINNEFDKYEGFVAAAGQRALTGFAYLLVNMIGSSYVPDDYFISPNFVKDNNIFTRVFLLGLWARCTLYKYISCWMLTEGSAIHFGITYAGTDDKGKHDWSGCSNIKLVVFENAQRFQHYIDSFNVQTNHWVAEYVYKRLKFLGNRYYSQFGTLLFLAVWHGFHSGYYMCFLMEFLVMLCEHQVEPVFKFSPGFQKFASTAYGKIILWIVMKLYTFIGMGFSLAPLAFLSFWKWSSIYVSVWFFGLLLWVPWPIYVPVLKKLLGTKKPEKKKE